MTGALVGTYDYGGLRPESVEEMEGVAEQSRKGEHCLNMGRGRAFLGVSHFLPFEEFCVWMEERAGIDRRRGAECMRVAKYFEHADPEIIQRMSWRVLLLMTTDGCPLEAIEECLGYASREEPLPVRVAKEIIEKHKPEEEPPELPKPEPSKEKPKEPKTKEERDEIVADAISNMEVGTYDDEVDAENVEDVTVDPVDAFLELWASMDSKQRTAVCEAVWGSKELDKLIARQAKARGEIAKRNGTALVAKTKGVVAPRSYVIDGNSLPESLNTPEFCEAWSDWYRSRKKGLQEKAIRQRLKQMEEWGHDRSVAALKYSFMNGYVGIHEADSNGAPASNGKTPKQAARMEAAKKFLEK